MGTSQSLNLKTTPNWSSAKKAMTTIVRHRNEVTQPMVRNFLRQLCISPLQRKVLTH